MKALEAKKIFDEDLEKITVQTDWIFFWLLLGQWIFGIFLAIVWSPRTWIAEYWSVHQHVLAAAILGGFLALYPLYLIIRQPGAVYTRHVIAVAQMLQSALLIHVTGGRIETHFHIFGSLAILAFYRDWKVLVTATVVVYLHHLVLGLWFPLSVYGVVAAPVWRALEHAFWVIFEVVFLTLSCRRGIRELHMIAERQAEVKEARESLEEKVKIRTAELVQANEELKRLDVMKNEFIAVVSHELRTPLTSIQGSLGILIGDMAGELSEKAHTLLEIGMKNCKRLVELINNLLDFERMNSGNMEFELKPTFLFPLVQRALEINQKSAEEHHIKLVLEERLSDAQANIEGNKLVQVISSLISNAIKFSPDHGTIKINMTRHQSSIRISVNDQGPGIPEEFKSRIFQKFSQADSSNTRRTGGTGLGLSISKELIEKMGGKIGFETSSKGSTFYFDLPEVEPGKK